MVNLNECDHEQFLDLYTNKIFVTCFCFCPDCYSQERFISEGNGCIDSDCFCRNMDKLGAVVRLEPPTPHEDVVADLPEKPGKTGTCRECKAPTYRQGTRGRFPVMCPSCKDK